MCKKLYFIFSYNETKPRMSYVNADLYIDFKDIASVNLA